ncbi:ras association domain-containing protein 10 [Rhinoraja longicauda]
MEGKECKIGVWVYQEEKLVSGLSRRTSCQDVIAALLEDAGLSDLLSGALDTYSLVEKWRGLERTLPNKTKVLRLWAAWGEERHNVTLVLEKTRVELGSTGPRSAQAKVVASKGKAGNPGKAGSTTAMSRDKHRRVVRKAFRKLAKMKRCKRQESGGQGGEGGERMETLVHLVLSQDHTIRQQLQRLRALDRDIERCEATVHQDRIREHGANYVQDTYLEGGGGGIEGEEGPADGVPLLEEAVLLDQLDTSVSAGQRLDSELETCALELEQSRAARDHQRGEMDRLLGELRQAQRTVQAPQPTGWTPTGCPAATGTDDSDTGLSSMNSLDSDATPVSESLV